MKKHINLSVLFVLLFTCSALAQNDLEITVKNIKEVIGSIRVGLFVSENDFLKKPVEGKVVKVASNEITVTFKNLKSGPYAVSVIHDKNENGELDSNFMGIPNEPYGFSNNAMGNFGPPSFEKAKLQVNNNTSSVINLR